MFCASWSSRSSQPKTRKLSPTIQGAGQSRPPAVKIRSENFRVALLSANFTSCCCGPHIRRAQCMHSRLASSMKKPFRIGIIVCLFFSSSSALAQEIKILTNQIGYEPSAPKRAVILGHAGDDVKALQVLDETTGKPVLSATVAKAGGVDQ